MATAETVEMGTAHPPKAESIKAFNDIEVDLKKMLQHQRHEQNKHEPEFFYAVKNLSDEQLTTFTADDLKEVIVAQSAYGMHLLGKVLIPESDPSHAYPEKGSDAYIMFRAFLGNGTEPAKLHAIRMDTIEKPNGEKVFKAIFFQNDPLEWFEI